MQPSPDPFVPDDALRLRAQIWEGSVHVDQDKNVTVNGDAADGLQDDLWRLVREGHVEPPQGTAACRLTAVGRAYLIVNWPDYTRGQASGALTQDGKS